jgi:hypothetical protein
LFGVISIGDILKAHHDQLEVENFFMTSYIRGEGADVGPAPAPQDQQSVAHQR